MLSPAFIRFLSEKIASSRWEIQLEGKTLEEAKVYTHEDKTVTHRQAKPRASYIRKETDFPIAPDTEEYNDLKVSEQVALAYLQDLPDDEEYGEKEMTEKEMAEKEMAEKEMTEREMTEKYIEELREKIDEFFEPKTVYTKRYEFEGRTFEIEEHKMGDHTIHAIEFEGETIYVFGRKAYETIQTTFEDERFLRMTGAPMQPEYLNFYLLQQKEDLNTKATHHVFIYSKPQKKLNEDELSIQEDTFRAAFTKEVLETILKGQEVLVPFRQGSNPREGHWQTIRVQLCDGELNYVFQNSIGSSRHLSIADIHQMNAALFQPIFDYLKKQDGFSKEMKLTPLYTESRQYADMGCGIAAIINIMKNTSRLAKHQLKESDQRPKRPEEKGSDFKVPDRRIIESVSLLEDALMRVDLAKAYQTHEKKQAGEFGIFHDKTKEDVDEALAEKQSSSPSPRGPKEDSV
jgi:hypothetical protein